MTISTALTSDAEAETLGETDPAVVPVRVLFDDGDGALDACKAAAQLVQ